MGAMVISIINPAIVLSATICDYDSNNPSLDHAVKAFMDPAQFDCAELEIRAVMDATDPSETWNHWFDFGQEGETELYRVRRRNR